MRFALYKCSISLCVFQYLPTGYSTKLYETYQVHDRGPRHPPQRAQPARRAAALCAVLGHAAQAEIVLQEGRGCS